jgi:hypothetical protein
MLDLLTRGFEDWRVAFIGGSGVSSLHQVVERVQFWRGALVGGFVIMRWRSLRALLMLYVNVHWAVVRATGFDGNSRFPQ